MSQLHLYAAMTVKWQLHKKDDPDNEGNRLCKLRLF
jgi:hypothetical protein